MLNKSIEILTGVGKKRTELFNKLGIITIHDLIHYFPRDFEDRTRFKKIFETIQGETVCIKATVFSPVTEKKIRKGLTIYTLILHDTTGQITARWFNNPYILNKFKRGEEYIFYGKITKMGTQKFIENPVYELNSQNPIHTGKIMPVYPLTAGLSQKILQQTINEALKIAGKLPETLPNSILSKYNLAEINFAIKNIHFPKSYNAYEKARQRLVFEELFILQLTLLFLKENENTNTGIEFKKTQVKKEFTNLLPYSLTNAQSRVIDEILGDFNSNKCLNRLIQGDVGSGKTIIAAFAMYLAAKNNYQAALMVPTEILANQHYNNITKLFDTLNVVLLTGSLNEKEKKEVYNKISCGKANIIIGTHAIIQQSVKFKNLGLVVTDEQHRFGVIQRKLIAQKGENPHIIVMSATPIPRTLALILYGDLDVSVVDELPPGRKKVDTFAVDESMRQRVYEFIRKNINQNRQCYIVCPLAEESESFDYKNVVDFQKKLANTVFPEFKTKLLHGKLPSLQKDQIMKDYINGEIDILVTTTVIEVGVDVNNANIMVIENAERFGLSQLHQLRGRIGRGEHKSYCIMFNQSDNPISKKRMEIMCKSNDGFYISEMDLKLRGPGDFFGVRQHGLPPLKIANLFSDINILKEVQKATKELIKKDPKLSENKSLNLKIKDLMSKVLI